MVLVAIDNVGETDIMMVIMMAIVSLGLIDNNASEH